MNLTISTIDESNYKEILELKVSDNQVNFIESVKECLEEAKENSVWKPVGIYYEKEPIGFAMYGLFLNEGKNGRVWLDRFLISHTHQGKGYGEAGVRILINELYKEYGYKKIYLSVYDSNIIATSLYKKIGFEFNGEVDIKGEKVMVMNLNNMEYKND